jgi:hypothetical protein
VRIVLELELGGRGTVTRAVVRQPVELDGDVAACLQDSIKAGLIVTAPASARPTQARMELLLAQ